MKVYIDGINIIVEILEHEPITLDVKSAKKLGFELIKQSQNLRNRLQSEIDNMSGGSDA